MSVTEVGLNPPEPATYWNPFTDKGTDLILNAFSINFTLILFAFNKTTGQMWAAANSTTNPEPELLTDTIEEK